ncbi:MAG: hypothetical protein NUW12_09470 [Firmicutes bacterium]|jgi:hypothetical protein|nr:hypothetical protein [Bacillota bacterium]MDH7496144.1 hypothetical protein [Bacillota bacterium]
MAASEAAALRYTADESYAWWASLRHGGLLIAPSHLAQNFPPDLSPLPRHLEDRLRRDIMRASDGRTESLASLLDTVLEDVLGLENDTSGAATKGRWFKGGDVPSEWSSQGMTGEIIKPRRLWKGPHGALLPVFVESERAARLGTGRGRRTTSRVIEWLRHKGERIALLTNGRQWRLVYAGLDHDAFAEWDTALWFEEGRTGLQVTALRALLGRDALVPSADGQPCALLAAIVASRKGQAELSTALGERVRQAVELLIREHSLALENADLSVKSADIYHAATRVVMRMVVALFAEARDLLPRDNPIYHGSYGLGGLREMLDRSGGGAGSDRLRHQFTAWPRILALFRLVYEGSPHEALPVPRYAGNLFEQGDPCSDDPVRRALSVFEDPENSPNDAAVHEMLTLLCHSRVKIRQGRNSMWIDAPVDFSDLSSEYVGMLYEGLLDFELRRASDGDPIVFLNLGDQPALPLSRLEALDDKAVARLVEKSKERTRRIVSEESGEENEDEETAGDEDTDEAEPDDDGAEPEDDGSEESGEPADGEETPGASPSGGGAGDDARRAATERAWRWALRAVKVGRLVHRPRSSSPAALREYEALCGQAAKRLVARVVLPGEWYLVRWGGTRKGAGTFYTRPQLAVPTIHRTLRPLAYETPIGPDGPADDSGNASASRWIPRRPEEILALKVCDPACGSGSFLTAALRFLTDALVESLHYHGRIRNQGERAVVTLAEGRPESGRLSDELLPCRPDSDGFEAQLRARLKRYVVERCIYGVDIDPLAVELARVALWIETMDPALPFSFLDHKVKVGNSLVGCWFDRFRDYPVLAWEREGGDSNHTRGVRFEKGTWTKAIKKFRNERIRGELKTWLEGRGYQLMLPLPELNVAPEAVHDEATALLERMHDFAVHESEERAVFYRDRILGNPAFQRLKEAFDTWCAIWFWPAERLEDAPTPLNFTDPPRVTRDLARQLASEHRFFHWELEFPDVFARPGSGFDAVVGNPPWEIQKPNSKEFFSNIDPLYRTYGKQEALDKQSEYFQRSADDERNWLAYCARLKALSNWVKNAGLPFGDGEEGSATFGLGRSDSRLLDEWRARRAARRGYADPEHAFRYQGSADINTYKMFLEQAHALLREGGRMGIVVPSGVYTDKGASDLRKLLLARCRWEWLFGFENRDKVFDIDSRFKFCPIVVQKGGETESIQTAFMRRNLADWEEGERYAIPYARVQVERFSPNSRAILEIRNRRDLEILEKIYANSVLLGDVGPRGWQIKYAREFDMTTDSELFPPRPWWEAQGYRPDEYGRWLKGRWHEGRPAGPRWEMEPGVILSVDGTAWIHEDEIDDIALPLYEGRMIGQFDFSQKGWVRGKGRGAVWREMSWAAKVFEPQYLMALETCRMSECPVLGCKMPVMNISSATNSRTVVGAFAKDFPCNHSLNPIRSGSLQRLLAGVAIFNSWVFDFAVRARMGGVNLSYFVLDEVPMVQPGAADCLPLIAASTSLSLAHRWFSPEWLKVASYVKPCVKTDGQSIQAAWEQRWALTAQERLRLRCIIDAIAAELYGLDWDDLAWILRECDYPAERLQDKTFTRMLDPKGFWRVDKDKDPELRHTVLTLAAFRDLKEIIASEGDRDKGIEVFCSMNGGEGWMLPETVRLADLGLGHDERAKRAQPVRERLGGGSCLGSWRPLQKSPGRSAGCTPATS